MSIFYPIEKLAEGVLVLLEVPIESGWYEPLHFFIYDSVKIGILLSTIIFAVTFARSYLHPAKVKRILTNRFPIIGNILAALIGTITPFCSCSAVPLFIGFLESGVPLGVTFSYLVSAPMVNEVAVILLFGMFGWKIALLYAASGVMLAVISGVILGKMRLEKWVEDYVWELPRGEEEIEIPQTLRERFREAYEYAKELFKKVFPYVLVGVGFGAAVHGYVPAEMISKIAGPSNPFAVLIAVLIGIPLYSNAAGIIPVVSAMVEKGMLLGTALAFMMSVTALSFPEMVILRNVLKPKLLALFFGIVGAGIVFTGYFFNLVL